MSNESDRDRAELRGPVRTCVEETILPDGSKYLTTTDYSPDGRLFTRRHTNSDGSEWVTTQTYDSAGHLAKTVSGKIGEPYAETLYTYDEAGRLLTIMDGPERGGRVDFHYHEQGRKTTIRRFDPKELKQVQNAVSALTPWDTAESGMGIPPDGKVITVYDENDQPTEQQIRDVGEHIVCRNVRTYDANGRILEEKQIQENPALLFAERFIAEQQVKLTGSQLEAMNSALKLMLAGQNGTGISYSYDAQGRAIEVRERNFAFVRVRTTRYNEQGDKAEERTNIAVNSVIPIGVPHSLNKDGTLVPSGPAANVPALGGVPQDSETHYSYKYDNYGNWTEETVSCRVRRADAFESSTGRQRSLTYY
jgi:hypothetical protein